MMIREPEPDPQPEDTPEEPPTHTTLPFPVKLIYDIYD